jgi:hypothetical protein
VRFSDLIPGFVIRTSPRLVTAKEMVEFASRFDSQWFHVDERVDSKRVAHLALRFEVLRSSKSPSGRTGILLSKSELWNQNDRHCLYNAGDDAV